MTAHRADDDPEDHNVLKRLTTRAVAGTTLLLTVALTGCTAQTDSPDATAPSSATPDPAPAPVPAEAEPLVAEYGLDGMDAVEMIDYLDRLGGAERPENLMASVRPGELVVSAGSEEFSLDIPEEPTQQQQKLEMTRAQFVQRMNFPRLISDPDLN